MSAFFSTSTRDRLFGLSKSYVILMRSLIRCHSCRPSRASFASDPCCPGRLVYGATRGLWRCRRRVCWSVARLRCLLDCSPFLFSGFTDVQRRLLAVTAQTSPDFALSSQAPSPIDIPATPAREYLDDLHPQPPTPRNSKANSSNKVHVITPSGVSTKTSPESFFEELGSDVGVDAEVIRMVYERLFSLH